MKKVFFYSAALCIALALYSFGRNTDVYTDKGAGSGNMIAEEMEIEAKVQKPDGWEDADWEFYNKNFKKEELFKTITTALLNGKLKARDYFRDSVWFTPQQVKSMITRIDTMYLEDLKTGKMTRQPVENSLTGKDISVIKMREKWYFDPQTFVMKKKVIGLSFHYNYSAPGSNVKGLKPLFYVQLPEEKNSGK